MYAVISLINLEIRMFFYGLGIINSIKRRGVLHINLRYGKSSVRFTLPEHTQLQWLLYNSSADINEKNKIAHALACPIGTPSLREIARHRQNAIILISDRSRLCPSYLFLEALLQELNEAGLEDNQIKIMIALGMHRKQTTQEMIELVGISVWNRIDVFNHSSLQKDCVHVGITSRGTPIEINTQVVHADLRIATGNIEPHRLTGMSGGVKALVPGVASHKTIEANHALSQKHPSVPGEIMTPIRADLEEALQFVPIHFLFNLIVNQEREVLSAVAGDIIEAHRAGVRSASPHFFSSVKQTYDVVIASAGGFPKDMQLYQAIKTLQNAADFTKPNGSIVLIARCEEIFGNGLLQYWIETIQDRKEMVRMLEERFVLGPHKILHISTILQKHSVFLLSEVPKPLVELLGFEPIEDLQQILDQLVGSGNPEKTIAIMPNGALTFSPQL